MNLLWKYLTNYFIKEKKRRKKRHVRNVLKFPSRNHGLQAWEVKEFDAYAYIYFFLDLRDHLLQHYRMKYFYDNVSLLYLISHIFSYSVFLNISHVFEMIYLLKYRPTYLLFGSAKIKCVGGHLT